MGELGKVALAIDQKMTKTSPRMKHKAAKISWTISLYLDAKRLRQGASKMTMRVSALSQLGRSQKRWELSLIHFEERFKHGTVIGNKIYLEEMIKNTKARVESFEQITTHTNGEITKKVKTKHVQTLTGNFTNNVCVGDLSGVELLQRK